MFRTNTKGVRASMSSNNRHNPTTAPSSSPAISRSAWITLVVISSVGLIPMYGETVIIPAIPDFIKEFGITYTTSSWILAAFLIAGAVMTPIAGKLSDIYGKKKIVLIIMCIYTIGVALGGFSSNISFLIIARILQGIGISMFPIAFGLLKLQFPKEKLSIAQGIFTGAIYGWLSNRFSFRRNNNLPLWMALCTFIYGTCSHNPNPNIPQVYQY